MKKILSLSTLALAGVLAFTGCSCKKDDDGLAALPAARVEDCNSNDYDSTCSPIAEKNLDEYLGREDTAYIDLRSFAEYSESHVKGFQNLEFFTYIYGDDGQLFWKSGDKQYAPRYEGSVAALEAILPKDKNIFFMCLSGGRVKHMMKIMELNGWDMTKVYNVGGISAMNTQDWADEYLVTVSKYKTETQLLTGVDTTDGASYKTIVNLTVDANNKIKTIYVTGTPYTPTGTEAWNPETWIAEANAYAQKLVGKTLADINTMLGSDNKAEGADVVTGASLTSNRVLRAAKAALTPAA